MLPHIASKPVLALACLALIATPAAAVDIAANTSPNSYSSNDYYSSLGQSFTVTGSGSYTNIRFNFFTGADPLAPYAVGTGFLLSTAYTGLPGGLSNLTTGYLGQANAASGFYDFGSTVTLGAGIQYFFYSNGVAAPGYRYNSDSYSAGERWKAVNSSTDFASSQFEDALFRVTGDAVVARAPDSGTTALLLGMSLLGLVAIRRKLS